MCDGINSSTSLTPDCNPRIRLAGARRFETLFSTLYDSTGDQLAPLEAFHTLGIQKVLIITDQYDPTATYAYW